jgi:hypothetical protein
MFWENAATCFQESTVLTLFLLSEAGFERSNSQVWAGWGGGTQDNL